MHNGAPWSVHMPSRSNGGHTTHSTVMRWVSHRSPDWRYTVNVCCGSTIKAATPRETKKTLFEVHPPPPGIALLLHVHTHTTECNAHYQLVSSTYVVWWLWWACEVPGEILTYMYSTCTLSHLIYSTHLWSMQYYLSPQALVHHEAFIHIVVTYTWP